MITCNRHAARPEPIRLAASFLLAALSLLSLWPAAARASTSPRVVATESMVVARQQHVATVLTNGLVLITGGLDSQDAVLAAAEVYDPAANAFRAVASMTTPRLGQTATKLADGRVLIAGGDGDGTAEIFDPQTESFTAVANPMTARRAGHSATTLLDGRVLIAGGDAAGTAELFDPPTESFTAVGNLAAARTDHSATLFADDSVLLAGGGTDSAEFFDATTLAFTLAPQAMTAARTGPTAIAAANEKVLLVDGDTGHTVEQFDPATDSFTLTTTLGAASSTATLLANENILVLGPQLAGLLSTDGSQWTALADAATLERQGQTATALPADKRVLVAGGLNASNQLVNTAALFNPAWVATDLDDYPPDAIMYVSGGGFQAQEQVELDVLKLEGPNGGSVHDVWTTQADASGALFDVSWQVCGDDCVNALLQLTATGQSSGLSAQTRFTDAPNPSITSFSPTNKTVCDGAFTLTINGNNFQSGATVTFKGNSRTATFVSASRLTVSILASDLTSAGTPAVVVRNPDNKTDTANYPVNKATTTATLSSSANPSVYGVSVTFTASVISAASCATLSGTVSFKDGATTLGSPTLAAGVATFSTAALTGGVHSVTAVYNGDANFNTSTSSAVSQTVTKAPLTVTANDASRAYGAANPAFTASYAGFVNGETLATSGVTGSPSLSTTATAASPVTGSPYTITAATGTLSSGNYSFTFVNGQLSLTKVSLTVTANGASRAYGSANPVFTASYSGFANSETLATSDVTGNPSLTTAATTNSTVAGSPYSITAAIGSLASGNYNFSFVNGQLTVTKAVLTVTADDKTRAYGALNPTFTASYTGFVNSETLATSGVTGSPSLSTAATTNSTVAGSPYPITTAVGTLAAGNYSFSFVNGQLTVTKAPLTVTADNKSRAYGAANPAFTASYAGFVNGQTLATSGVTGSPSLTTAATTNSPVAGSPYPIAAALGTLSATNYSFATFNNGQLTITTATLTVTADAKTKVYGDAVPTLTASYAGFVNGETLATSDLTGSPSLSTTTTTNSTVAGSPYTITTAAGSQASGNYSLSLANGQLTVTRAPLTVTVNDASRVYGAPNPTFTAGYTGFVLSDTASVVSGSPSFSTTATASSLVAGSPYAITAIIGSLSAANYSFTTFNPGALTITVANSTTAVSSSVNPSAFGQAVSFTATVSPVAPATGTRTGTVQFQIDGVNFGAPVALASGSATSGATNSLALGTHTVTAVYSGDGNFSGSTSVTFTQTVNNAATTIAVTSSANPSVSGQSVTLTATVTAPAGGTPTGTVTFKDGAATLGTDTLNGSGVATLTTATLALGAHSITAVYGGDSDFTGSTSTALSQTVNKADTTSVAATSGTPTVYGESVTFTATIAAVAPGAGTPTGTVTFKFNNNVLGTGTLNGAGVATFTTNTLAVQGYPHVHATYAGDSAFNGRDSAEIRQDVNQADSSTSVATSVNPSVFGQVVTFTATVSPVAPSTATPTGTARFTIDGTTITNVTLNGSGQATLSTAALSVGNHTVAVAYLGNANFNTSNGSLAGGQTVSKAATSTAVASSLNPSFYGQAVTFTATVSAVAPGSGTRSGSVTFTIDGTTTTNVTLNGSGQATLSTAALTVGNHSVAAAYNGDANFTTSNGSLAGGQTVNKNLTTTAVASSLNPSGYGQSVTFTATVTSGAGTPTGTVTFQDGAATLGTGTLDGSGQATFTTAVLAGGSHTITAVYGSDATFDTSTGTLAGGQTVNAAATSTALVSSVNPSTLDQLVVFTATVASGAGTPSGTVTFAIDGAAQAPVTVDGSGQATLSTSSLGAGTHSITATYGGTASFAASGSATLTQTVNATPVVTVHPAHQNTGPGNTVSFSAAAAGFPTATVQWQVSTNGGASFSDVTGATSTSFNYNAANGDHGKKFRARFQNAVGSATSNPATLSLLALDATSATQVTRGGIRINPTTKRYGQTITIKNIGATASGPISLVVDSLTAGITVYQPVSTTSYLSPLGSPYKTATASNLASGSSVSFTIEFINPNALGINYNYRVLIGTGLR